MQPISRRLFLTASVAVVLAACSGDDGDSTPSDSAAPDSGSPDGTAADVTSAADPTTAVTTPVTEAPSTTEAPIELAGDPFTLGVASGDATSESVVLWTRLAPDPLAAGGMPDVDVTVTWELSSDDTFATIELTGTETARPAEAHSVHAVVSPPVGGSGTAWHYRFRAAGYTSPTGRTALAPAPGDPAAEVRFAAADCQHYEDGYYIAHRDIAAQQPDFVVFLGDYIYEGRQGVIGEDENVRSHGTDECRTLDDYRNRYALYRSDPDLQAAHATCPWYVTWDDHEVENNYAGVIPQDAADAATFEQRRHDAYKAWWEHQPVALPPPPEQGDFPIYRAAQWGDLLTLVLLDGRQYRSDQACGDVTLNLDPPCPETFDEARTMLGDTQEQWLFGVLDASTAVWNVIGQQTVFGDVTIGGAVLNYDQWDGYPAQRNRIVDRLATDGIANAIVLTGDIHFGGTGLIRSGARGTGTPVAVEFVSTSITSGGLIDPGVTEVVKAIPDILDVELAHRGYVLHTVTPEQWRAEFRMVDSVKTPESDVYVHATYVVDAGTSAVRFADT